MSKLNILKIRFRHDGYNVKSLMWQTYVFHATNNDNSCKNRTIIIIIIIIIVVVI